MDVDVETTVDDSGDAEVAESSGVAAAGDVCSIAEGGVLITAVAVGAALPQADIVTSIASAQTLATQRERSVIKVFSVGY